MAFMVLVIGCVLFVYQFLHEFVLALTRFSQLIVTSQSREIFHYPWNHAKYAAVAIRILQKSESFVGQPELTFKINSMVIFLITIRSYCKIFP